MDLKAKVILEHYKEVIENRKFDEYDILGFFIFIRAYVNKEKFELIYEFLDHTAHRKRNQGKIMNAIIGAIENKYEYDKITKKIKGYNAFDELIWKEQWKKLGEKFNIRLNDSIIKEITLCIFSLVQESTFDDKIGHKGIIKIDAISKSGEIALFTTEGKPNDLYICFFKYGGYKVDSKYDAECIEDDIVYTCREDGKLRLKSKLSDSIIVEI